MKNAKIKKGALIGYGIAVEGDEFDAFGNPTQRSRPLILEGYLDNKGFQVRDIAKDVATRGVMGRVVVVELRAVEEITVNSDSSSDLSF